MCTWQYCIIKEVFKYLIFAACVGAFATVGCTSTKATAKPANAQATSSEVTFTGAAGLELHGTFLVPPASKPVPAVLLLPGSGPTDRDGNSKLLSVKVDLLKTIAERLAQVGIASLRFDKRAVATYQAKWPKTLPELNTFFGWRKFVEDAEGGLTFLKSQKEVDPTKLVLLGHSEGALISLQIASEVTPQPAAVVLIGSTGRKMGAVIHDQIARQLAKAPTVDPKPYMTYVDTACAAVAAGKPLPPNPPAGLSGLFNASILDLLGNYCRIDPTDLAKKYDGPVLALNGEGDTQVSPTDDTKPLAAALKSRSHGTVDVMIVPDASHNLKSIKAGGPDAFDGPVNAAALDKIATWLVKTLGLS